MNWLEDVVTRLLEWNLARVKARAVRFYTSPPIGLVSEWQRRAYFDWGRRKVEAIRRRNEGQSLDVQIMQDRLEKEILKAKPDFFAARVCVHGVLFDHYCDGCWVALR